MDEEAFVFGFGLYNLEVGANTIKINVINGEETNTYTLTVNRADEDQTPVDPTPDPEPTPDPDPTPDPEPTPDPKPDTKPEVKPDTKPTTPKPSVFPQTGFTAATSFIYGTGLVGLGASILAALKRRQR